MDFADLGWLLFGFGVLCGGIGLCVIAFTGRDLVGALHRVADVLGDRDREEA